MPTIEIDGKQFEAENGQMLIQVADANGINIPRFCYHKKLSVAANCRMCLVDVEKAPKPMPACATPIMDGMKVHTKSPRAISAQKNVMEFLLINHPLDCPICDQGGECELQDVSVGYGQEDSQYNEGKRSVEDEALGSLISTEMTRCIHCTRCVRFGDEVAGLRELGATGRGEDMKIGTYVQQALTSEVSGNIIDLCPVGALTSRPYRFTARAWELQQKKSIAPHDCLGSHVNVHVRRNKVMRVVPEECERINETWLSDRDRFAYTGLYQDRVTQPMIKKGNDWVETDWETALTVAVEQIKQVLGANGHQEFAGLASHYATTEEYYLFQKFLRALGINHIDHRVTQQDFRDETGMPHYPGLSAGSYADFSTQQAVLLVGSDIHREQPLAGVRLRQAQKQGCQLMSINCHPLKSNLELAESLVSHPLKMGQHLAAVLKAAAEQKGVNLETSFQSLLKEIQVSSEEKAIAKYLCEQEQSLIVLGQVVESHIDGAVLRALAYELARVTESRVTVMTTGPNQAGAYLAGVVPHRGPAGQKVSTSGFHAGQILSEFKKGYLLLHLEPEDCLDSGQAFAALKQAETVVAITAFDSPALREYASVILPAASFTETSGTFVNMEGQWQTFCGVTRPLGESRPAWKILRVLGNLIDLDGFEFCSSEEVLNELKQQCSGQQAMAYSWKPQSMLAQDDVIYRIGQWGLYGTDPLQRRAKPLQESAANDTLELRVSPNVAKVYNLRQGKSACALQHKAELSLTVIIDEQIPENCVYLPTGFTETSALGALFSEVDLK